MPWQHYDERPPLDDHTRLAMIQDLQRKEAQLHKLERDAGKLAGKLKGGDTDGRKPR